MKLQTGAGTTASRLGQPDLAIAQLYEMRENADMIAGLDPYGPPLIADMDTGYGGKILSPFSDIARKCSLGINVTNSIPI